MEGTYKKNKGNAGLVGTQFQLNLLTVCLLNALKHRIDWRISTENPEAGKYDDIVVELPGTTAILIQAKHKESRKVTREQLLSDNSKNADFSLAKYFFSYEEIKKKFKKRVVIICTDTTLNNKGLEGVLTQHNADAGSMLHCGDQGCSFYTFNENIVPDLKASAAEFLDKNLKGRHIDSGIITDKNVKDFLSNLQVFTNYPSQSEMHAIISQLLSGLQESSLWRRTSSQDVYKKVEDWFIQPKGEYLTEFRAKAFFCEIKSDKYVEALKDFRVSFDRNHFKFGESKRIFHVTAEGVHLLQVLKVYHALQDKNKKLYANPEDDMEVHKHVIEAFGLPRYAYLIMVWGKVTQGTLIKEIGDKLRDILEESPYKKVILVAEGNSVLPQQVGLKDVFQMDGSVTFKDLSKESQRKLLNLKNIDFQGKLVSLEELLEGQATEDCGKSLDARMLDELVKGTQVMVGVRPLDLDQDVARYYIPRRFESNANKTKSRQLNFAEQGIFDVREKVVLIADGAGTGKTTVLIKLAVDLKEKRPHLWIIRVNLNEYTRVLKGKKTIDVIELLNSEEGTKLTTRFERFIFSLKEKVVIMLDGVDEVSPGYTTLILNLILQCQKAQNFAKILVTTRPHMTPQLEAALDVGSYRLLPLTNYNQIDFLSRYWAYNLQMGDYKSKMKCEQYARSITSRVSSLATDFYWDSDFSAIPLLLKSLAEIFQKNLREHIEEGSVQLNLPEKFIAELYDAFVENKRDIFIEKGNPRGNVRANEALNDQFEECLACHSSLAVQVVLNVTERDLFSNRHRDDKTVAKHALILGVVEEARQFKHKMFEEYFLSDAIMRELQLPNTNAQFQQFLIEEILQKPEYKVVRVFLNNLLEKVGDYLPPNIFESYHSTPNAWTSKENLILTLSNEDCVAVLRLILRSINFQTISQTDMGTDSEGDAGVNFRNADGDMPLHVAIKQKHVELAKCLIEQGADLLARDCTGRPSLHLAAERGYLETINLILERGVYINNREMCGRTAMYLAALNNYWGTVEYLLERGGDVNIIGKDGRTALHLAARTGNLNTLRRFLEHGVDVNIRDNLNCTALFEATNFSRLETVELLVEHKADVNVRDNAGRTVLHLAAKYHDEDIIKYLVKHGTDVNAKDNHGFTALHLTSCFKGKITTLKCLLESGAKINERNNDGHTTLHVAVMDDRLDFLQDIISHEGDIRIRDNDGRTALHLASRNCYGLRKMDIIKYLVGLGFDPNVADNFGRTALHVAAGNGKVDVIEYLAKNSLNVNAVDNNGRTALHYAAENGSIDIIRYFIERSLGVNVADREGCTAFHIAAERSSDDTVKFLVKHGADIKLITCDGSSALHFAAKAFFVDNIVYLVKSGLDVNVRNGDGRTALHIAAEKGKEKVVQYLVEHGAVVNLIDSGGHTALRLAVQNDMMSAVKCLVDKGADPNIKSADGRTALHVAVDKNNESTITYLVKHGADTNSRDGEGRAALQLVAEKCDSHVIQCFAQEGADLNIRSGDGRTPLHFAAEASKEYTIKSLVDVKADVDARDNYGNAALHLVIERDLPKSAEYLLEHEANINIKNNAGHTPLHLAAWYDCRDIIEYLVKHSANINARDGDGRTALHFATELGMSHTVKYLMKCGADGNIGDNGGRTAMHSAAQFGCLESIKCLVEHGADINRTDNNNSTALHLAARNSGMETVKLLLELGALINATDSDGCSVLHLAARHGATDVFELLIAGGADVTVSDNEGRTAQEYCN